MFCKHEWRLLSDTVTKSRLEVAVGSLNTRGASEMNLPWQLCDASRTHIQVFACDKCGKLKRFVEEL